MGLNGKKVCLLTGLMMLLLFAACESKEEFANSFEVYYLNNEETSLVRHTFQTNSMDTEDLVEELLENLKVMPAKLEYKAPLAGQFGLIDYSISEDQIILSFDDSYKEQTVTTETLVRAALVRTLTQIREIKYVSIMVRSEPLTDSTGNIIGLMSADMFIENAGREFNDYEKVRLRLFFADESGERLQAISRNVVYNSNVSTEKLIVEQLIQGPGKDEPVFAVINPATKIISVTVKDRICYVNLDNAFLTQPDHVAAQVVIYSIANSLVELPYINKVQISVNGNTSITAFKENINLSSYYERNLDIVQAAD